jgi:hypothetical protein
MLTVLVALLVLFLVPFTVWLPAVVGFWLAGMTGAAIGAGIGVLLTVSLSY